MNSHWLYDTGYRWTANIDNFSDMIYVIHLTLHSVVCVIQYYGV